MYGVLFLVVGVTVGVCLVYVGLYVALELVGGTLRAIKGTPRAIKGMRHNASEFPPPDKRLRGLDERLSQAIRYRDSLAGRIKHMPEDWPEREVLKTYHALATEKCDALYAERRRIGMDIEDERAKKELGI